MSKNPGKWVVLDEGVEETFDEYEAAVDRQREINDTYGIDADGEGYCNAIVVWGGDVKSPAELVADALAVELEAAASWRVQRTEVAPGVSAIVIDWGGGK